MPAESTGQRTATITTVGTTAVVVPGTANQVGKFNAYLMTASATGIIMIYDNSTTNSGVMIGYVSATALVGTFQAYDIPYKNGIIVYDAGAGGVTLTIVYTVG